MLNITPICKRFKKHAFHFADNKIAQGRCTTSKGRYNSGTEIPDDLIPEFLLWLSPETKTLLITKGLEASLEYARQK